MALLTRQRSSHAEHGPDCETYKTAQSFIGEWAEAVKNHSDGVNVEQVIEEKESDFDEIADNLEDEFLKSILEDYSIMLQKEYEYLASEKQIIETIKSNEYTFTEAGKLENM